jgi:leader peptidase (prepilin peptidase)/N-methyltransferase
MTTRVGSFEPQMRRPRSPGALAAPAAGAAVGLVAGLAAAAGSSAAVAGVAVGMLAVAAGGPDVRERRIPNRVVVAGLAAAVVITVAVAAGGDRAVAGSVLGGAALAGGLLLTLHLLRPAALGFGDVKLAGVLGALVGVVHWSLAAVMLGAASLIGAVGALVVRGWRRSIPFGACLGAAAVASIAAAAGLRDAVGLW